MTKHIIGITRFALAGPMGEGRFHFPPRKKPAHLTKRAWIRSAGYLTHRLALWRAFALPSIRAQVWPPGVHYTHLVAVNPDLPCYGELRMSCTGSPAQLVDIPDEQRLEEALQPHLRYYADREPVFTFRLDDDDALVSDYLALVVEHWFPSRVLAPTNGFFIGLNPTRIRLRMVPSECPNAPQGIGVYSNREFIHDLGKHSIIPDPYNVNARPYWVRTVHRSNVTLAGHPGTPWGQRGISVDPRETLAAYFPHLDAQKIEASLRLDPTGLHDDTQNGPSA